ncbi:MAG: hypothetical protein IPL19_04695 [Sandaracinaceae bacterium]|jgi:hypothetical protein|nr:hypothetical protein [Sandaracinaceae bacterium]MBK8407269.1 hypothetical protein [Sandaracinaceae bacterium]MBK8589378.1 hypothetical protein [Sandaracinaceae bacterium]MBP7682243.1 hypothetical protein [Deltaproteobacteria bacterium]
MSTHQTSWSAVAFASAALLLTSACGLAPQPESDGVRVRDGIAPYSDQGGLQFCVGGQRLLPNVEREGVCRADAQVPADCEADSDCPSPESCVCGQCMVQLCQATSECRDGLICAGRPKRCIPRCNADEECGPYGLCNGGACETACWAQTDCPTGELCLVGRCAAVGCGPDGPNCFAGETCAVQALEGSVTGVSAIAAEDVSDTTEGTRIVVFAELSTPATPSAIVRFESEEGRRFVAVAGQSILPPLGATRIANPSVVRTPAGLYVFAELDNGASIVRALDPSGTGQTPGTFEVIATPAGWASEVRAPSAAFVNDRVIVAIAGASGEGIVIGYLDGATFALGAAPTLTLASFEAEGRFVGVSTLGGPDLRIEESAAGRTFLRLFADARATTLPVGIVGGPLDLPTSSVVYATALVEDGSDALRFHIAQDNPTFGRVQNFAPLEEYDPSVVRLGNAYLLYFADETGPRVARNPVRD